MSFLAGMLTAALLFALFGALQLYGVRRPGARFTSRPAGCLGDPARAPAAGCGAGCACRIVDHPTASPSVPSDVDRLR